MFGQPSVKRRWPRSQRFSLSSLGVEAETAYRSAIVEARNREGRAAFDEARTGWAQALRVEPDDGLYLGEIRQAALNLQQIVDALETCGKTRTDALSALERLEDLGLITAIAG
jgi:hypothetical protein